MRAAYEILLTRRNKVISPRQSVQPNVARAAPNPSQPQQERRGRRIAFISSARSAEGSSCSNYYPDFNTSTSKLRFSKFDSFNFFFFFSWRFWKLRSGQTRRRSSDIREELRGEQMLDSIRHGQLRRFCLCQACPARRRPRGRAGRRPKVSSSLPALERGHVLLEETLAGERMVGPSLGSLARRTRAEND